MKTSLGKEVEFRSLSYKERRNAAASMAKYLQDYGEIARCNYDVVELCVTKIDGKDADLELLHNDEVHEIAKEILDQSGFSKKKESSLD